MIAACAPAPNFAALRSRFPTLVERTYFATHCLGPVLDTTLADLEDYRRTILLRNRAIEIWLARIDEIRRLFAELVHAEPDEIALGGNATACHASLAAAIDPDLGTEPGGRPGGGRTRILTTSLDFPSTRYLWHAQARRGFEVLEVASPDGIAMPADALVAAIDERVAIVGISLVAYSNGALLRARRVIDAAHAAGAIVVLDAYQAIGIVPIDVRALGADAVIAGTHKWLHGASNGLAFAYVRRALAERLTPAYPGWFSHARTLDFDPVYTPAPGARRFEQGSTSVEAVYAARAGVRFALDAGVEAIRARSLALSDQLIAGADALGIPLGTPRDHAERAGVVCLGVRDPGRVAEQLRARGIDVDTRPGTGIRLSLHPCNLRDEVDRVLAELRRCI
ncbi:MAG TPA: aminotransferase class V-fold PLP-dependent enzyme [Kofleriaceae bacterium]|jgi:selenocysteine lyase/cysteine desulfurase|nr:aminotransferase class V-fold PLP-dependent enzyme [Kofleriaceae bacterium]